MDAVISGLGAGAVVSILIGVGGVTAYFSGIGDKYTNSGLFVWLCLLTAGLLGQVVLTYFLIVTFAASPSQTEKGVVL